MNRPLDFQRVFESLSDCVQLVSLDGSLLATNAAGLRFIEAESFAEVAGAQVGMWVGEKHRSAWRDLIRRVLLGESGQLELELNGVKGGCRWAEIHAAPLRDESDAVIAAVLVGRDVSVRKRQEQLPEEMERFRVLLESSLTGIYLIQDDKFRYVNPALAAFFGYAVDEIVDRLGPPDLTHPDDCATVAENLRRRMVAEIDEVRYEFRGLRKDGAAVRVEVHGRRVGYHGRPAIIGTLLDVTDRWRTQEALRRSQEHLTALVQSVDGIVWEADPATFQFTFVSPRAERLLGYPSAQWTNDPAFWVEHIHPDDREHAVEYCRRCTVEGRGHEFEYRMLARDGRTVWLRDIVTVIMERSRAAVLRGIMVDITDQKEAEHRIRRLNRTYAVLSDINQLIVRERQPEAICRGACRITVEKGGFLLACLGLVNRTTHRLEIAAHAGADGDQPILEQIFGSARPGCELTADVLRTGTHAVCNDIAHRAEGGVWRDESLRLGCRSTVALPLVIDGSTAGVFNLYAAEVDFFDIEELQLLEELAQDIAFALEGCERERERLRVVEQLRVSEEQLRHAQKMDAIGRLAGGVAHDFNNILAAIRMQADLTGLVEGLPVEAREGLQQIQAAADRAADLTRQLLLFGRRQMMQLRELDLNAVITNLAKMLQRIIGEDVRLQLQLHPTPLWTRGDAGMFDQVLMNLAVNARDAMPEGGRLLIETTEKVIDPAYAALHPDALPGRCVSVTVSDNGNGIAPGVLPRIFEPFFTTKAPGKGTGLGLATVFGIVKQHRGWITVESRLGDGTRFEIFLPTSEAGGAPAAVTGAQPKPRGGMETILMAEDDLAVGVVTRAVLERFGYQVLPAATGAEALQLWTKNRDRVALLLTDLVMPGGMSGQELASRLQVDRPNLKVIYTSGYSADVAGRHLDLQPEEKFLQKPFPPEELLKAVRESLDA